MVSPRLSFLEFDSVEGSINGIVYYPSCYYDFLKVFSDFVFAMIWNARTDSFPLEIITNSRFRFSDVQFFMSLYSL